ncbi:hypothetical protein ZWY2020_042664 [Hordeum vulgare]|nr:hypothetical protein ZWY2020_042664 [Hordeum vulgare]
MSSWFEDMDAEALLEIAWVKIGKIPLEKICDKNIAYVGGLVGISLEVDMSTVKRPSFVHAKIGCRSIDMIPATTEGCMGRKFYKFTYEIEEVLVRNPVVEEDEGVSGNNDEEKSPTRTPKCKRLDEEKKEKYQSFFCNNPGSSKTGGGKAWCHSPEKDDTSASSESGEDDDSLLIEQIARTHGMIVQQDCDKWLVRVNCVKFSPVSKAPVGLELRVNIFHNFNPLFPFVQMDTNIDQIYKVKGEMDPKLKTSNNYVVHLPSKSNGDIIPTSPLAPETSLRFSRRKGADLMMKMDQKPTIVAN